MTDSISEALGVAQDLESDGKNDHPMVLYDEKMKEIKEQASDFLKEDFAFARVNIKTLIEEGMDVVPEILGVAKNMQDSKMYEAASKFLKTISDLNKDLVGMNVEISKGKKETGAVPTKSENENVVSEPQGNNVALKGDIASILSQIAERERLKQVSTEASFLTEE